MAGMAPRPSENFRQPAACGLASGGISGYVSPILHRSIPASGTAPRRDYGADLLCEFGPFPACASKAQSPVSLSLRYYGYVNLG